MAAATLAEMAQAPGAMDVAVAMTQEYLTTRKQFGRPIGSFQALSHRLVDVMVVVEQARSMVILRQAIWRQQRRFATAISRPPRT